MMLKFCTEYVVGSSGSLHDEVDAVESSFDTSHCLSQTVSLLSGLARVEASPAWLIVKRQPPANEQSRLVNEVVVIALVIVYEF